MDARMTTVPFIWAKVCSFKIVILKLFLILSFVLDASISKPVDRYNLKYFPDGWINVQKGYFNSLCYYKTADIN